MPTKLPRSFYCRPALTVAKYLLGKIIVRRWKNVILTGKIVEVEAYLGESDPASHAYRGLTERNRVMFGDGGYLYVYFTYGMHFCANVVTGREGKAGAVLLRGIEPLSGLETMRKLRDFTDDKNDKNLTNGPAKLCEAFAIRREQNGIDLLGKEIYILDAPSPPPHQIEKSTRIGITNGRDKKWRFYVKGNSWVSKIKK